MNKIDSIIIHCSATKEGVNFKAKDIDRMHKQRGFNQIGYHYIIDLDGTIETGRPLTSLGAHCNTKGFSDSSYNKHSIGICYIGGLDDNGKPADTRTEAQKQPIHEVLAFVLQYVYLPVYHLSPVHQYSKYRYCAYYMIDQRNLLCCSEHHIY